MMKTLILQKKREGRGEEDLLRDRSDLKQCILFHMYFKQLYLLQSKFSVDIAIQTINVYNYHSSPIFKHVNTFRARKDKHEIQEEKEVQ